LLDQSQQRASRARWSFAALLPAPHCIRRDAKSIGKLFLGATRSPANGVDIRVVAHLVVSYNPKHECAPKIGAEISSIIFA
jgi:hypothetical protein